MVNDVPRDILEALLEREWNVRGSLTRIGGESLNLRVDLEDGERRVLKVLDADVSDALASLESAMCARVAGALPGLRLPVAVPTRSGESMVTTTLPDGRSVRARLLNWVEGTAWCDAVPASPARLHDLGATLARVATALDGFDAPAARRTHAWDLTRAGQHACHVALVQDPARRARLDCAFHHWRALARPRLAAFPHAVIHGDANDENVLVEDARVVGLIDFGDVLHNPRVCELAIALAYALLDVEEPLDDGAQVVAGWHGVLPLSAVELEALFPLICGRLANSLALAAWRRTVRPGHAAWFVTEDRAWRLLERLLAVPPIEAGRRLAERTGVEVHRGTSAATLPGLLERRHRTVGPSLSIAYEEPLHIVRGDGAHLFDHAGRPYLDLVNNVCHVGHCHPRVVAAGQAQMAVLNTNTRYLHENIVAYAEQLCATLPEPLRVCFFVNSGSEANELALRLAFAHTGRRHVAVVDAAYHGNTDRLIALSPYKFKGRGGAGEAQPWVHVVPLPDPFRGVHRGHTRETGIAYGEDVGRAIALADEPVAALLAESLPSCGGQIVPPPGWLETAFTHVRAAGALCIIDEVQTGFGRVGSRFWGFELQDVVPDIVVLGKPIANGHPMGAVVTTPEIAASFDNGMEFFSTFGGNPVSCAIASAVLDVIHGEGLQARAALLGRRFLDGLRGLVDRHPLAGHARGVGLFLGLELVRGPHTLEPAADAADAVVQAMRRRGILLSTDGPDHNVIKIKPPLVLDETDVDMTLRALDDVLAALAR